MGDRIRVAQAGVADPSSHAGGNVSDRHDPPVRTRRADGMGGRRWNFDSESHYDSPLDDSRSGLAFLSQLDFAGNPDRKTQSFDGLSNL